MLRTDGKYQIFRIQHKWFTPESEWDYSTYGTPEIEGIDEQFGFSASGNCFQETGINGVYDYEVAKLGLKQAYSNMVEDVSNHDLIQQIQLRLVAVMIEQKTTVII